MNIFRLVSHITSHPLNRDNRVAALMRLLRLQLAFRLMPGAAQVLPFVDGTVMAVRKGQTGATGNWYSGLLELSEMAFVLHALRPGDLFADIGANVGAYSVMAAGAAGADVLAVEPLPATFAALSANIALNGLQDRVRLERCGLSDAPGELAFTASLDTRNRIAVPADTGPVETVPVTTLDTLAGDLIPKVIKIDVEGHERWVLDGGKSVFGSPQLAAVIMETNQASARTGVTREDLIDRMTQFGFSECVYDPFARRIAQSGGPTFNTIFVRDPAAIEAVCRAAPTFRLINGSI